MKRLIRLTPLRTALLGVAALALAACASAPPRNSPDTYVDFSRFSGIAVDSVHIAPGTARNLDAKTREKLERDLTIALVDSVSPFARVDASKPGVLRVEVVVTELEAAVPGVNAVSQSLLFVAVERGVIGFEARLYEGNSTTPIAYETFLRTPGAFDLPAAYTRYKHAVDAVGIWGDGLAKRLEPTPVVARR
jgi:hypothetical protein